MRNSLDLVSRMSESVDAAAGPADAAAGLVHLDLKISVRDET